MSRTTMSRPIMSRSRSTVRRSSIGALALATALSLSACGGGDGEGAATAAQEARSGAADAAGAATDAAADAAGAATDAAADAAGAATDDHEHGAGAATDDHEHTPGMDMSGHDEGELKSFAELEKEAAIPASKPFNFQDVYFAQHMIEHHGQAVEMAEMLAANTKNPKMKKLADAIHGAQAPEIKLMTGWLKSWGQSTENKAHSHDPNAPSAGMMTDEDMTKLHAAKGRAFDRLFLKQMIFHHEGAVNQSNKEIKNGKFPAAKKLAKEIIAAQTKEIKLMKQLLKEV